MGNPEDFNANVVDIHVGQKIARNAFLRRLAEALYSRNEIELNRGNFRVKGDTVDIRLAYEEIILRVMFWGDEIESISTLHPLDNTPLGGHDMFKIYPANLFVTSRERQASALAQMELDLGDQVEFFRKEARELEARRLYERTTYDIEMIREVGHCPGIENYSRYFDGREPGMRPFCLLDYFPDDYLTIIDESHVTVPQIRAMYGGDLSRKENLVNYGFRMQSALDNRPLRFEEFESLTKQVIYVSATPADYELEKSEGVVVEQVIRPTGLLDPVIKVQPSEHQIDHLLEQIELRREKGERVLVTTLTKRMAEELNDYLQKLQIKSAYIHSDVDTLDRIKILDNLRAGVFDVLIGVNLLREGLDLPEVSLVAIIDADKEGFLRSHRSLTQTVGRAARNLNGMVIMYADKITDSMRLTIEETERRRAKQLAYNEEHGITPQAIVKARNRIIGMDTDDLPETRSAANSSGRKSQRTASPLPYENEYTSSVDIAADPVIPYMSAAEMQRSITRMRSDMVAAAKNMEFMEAARLRDEILKMEELLKKIQ
jgi:excinuclease ABC subunit B